ncbi:MAG TPA: NADH-quinone oxidoreductase subunit C [Arenicellales bacterium]|nr:NADH-quinone oxidoreductase subunit C [Arenicellales bacterium]
MTTQSPADNTDVPEAQSEALAGLNALAESFGTRVERAFDENTIVVERGKLFELLKSLRDDPRGRFEQLIDLCGIDFSDYQSQASSHPNRFAVVYHLLSISRNDRLRVLAYLPEDHPCVPTVIPIWACADWYEREAFDLFGILFEGHPDLRRLLTDYGFIGFPFRKDFPLSGHVEMRFDEDKGRVVYEPVSIAPRVTVPRVIRQDRNDD